MHPKSGSTSSLYPSFYSPRFPYVTKPPLYIERYRLYRRFDLECYACGLRCVRMCGEAPSRVRAYDCKPRSALEDTQAGTQVQWQSVCDLVCVRFPQVRFPISTAKRDEPVGMPRPCERHTVAFRITRRRTIDHAPLPNMGSAARRSRSRDGEYLIIRNHVEKYGRC